MSPTSYQAAPPRERMIADAGWFVKPRRAGRNLAPEIIKINFVNCVPALPRLCWNDAGCAGLQEVFELEGTPLLRSKDGIFRFQISVQK